MKNTTKTAKKSETDNSSIKTPVCEIKIKNDNPVIKAINAHDDEVLARAIRDLLKRDTL